MRARRIRSAFVAVLVIFAAATALAQRGGYRSQSYSGNVPYDGKFVFVRDQLSVVRAAGRAVGARLPGRRRPLH